MKMKTPVRRLAIGLVSALIFAEIILRAVGAVDFPVDNV
jgi:hypothetical protein